MCICAKCAKVTQITCANLYVVYSGAKTNGARCWVIKVHKPHVISDLQLF